LDLVLVEKEGEVMNTTFHPFTRNRNELFARYGNTSTSLISTPFLRRLLYLRGAPLSPAAPEKAKKIALARLDLIWIWEQYREMHPKPSSESRVCRRYNTGSIFPPYLKYLAKRLSRPCTVEGAACRHPGLGVFNPQYIQK
jgi:hypothetical protein